MFFLCLENLKLPQKCSHAVGSLILTLVLSLSLFESERIFRVLGEKNSSVFSLPEKDKTTFVALGGQRPGGEGTTSRSTTPPPPVAEEKQLRLRRQYPTGTRPHINKSLDGTE